MSVAKTQRKIKKPFVSDEKILVWDDFLKASDLKFLLEKNLPKGYSVEDTINSTKDGLCLVLGEWDPYIPVLSDDPRTNDIGWHKEASKNAPVVEGPRHLHDYGVVLARIETVNLRYVFPRLLWMMERKPDNAVFFYSNDKEALKGAGQEYFHPLHGGLDGISTRDEIREAIKNGYFFEAVQGHKFRHRALIADPDPVNSARYEGVILGKGGYTPAVVESEEEALESAGSAGIVLVNFGLVRDGWKGFASQMNNRSPRTSLVFYSDNRRIRYPEKAEAVAETEGLSAVFHYGTDIPKWIQYDGLSEARRIPTHDDKSRRTDFKKAGVFDSLERLGSQGRSWRSIYGDPKSSG